MFLHLYSVNGNWGEWSDYGECSRSCDGGQQIRTRQCDNPVPLNGGDDCVGEDAEAVDCNMDICSGESCPIFL